jgi:uncharacterized membrane protein
VKELLQGRRLGFAPRPVLGQVALGLAIAVTLLDLMAWFQWGARQTNGFVIGAYAAAIATLVVTFVATIAALAELRDAAEDDRGLARLDLLALVVALLIYVATLALRVGELSAAGANPAALLLGIAGAALLLVDGAVAANLYAGREWEELEEDVMTERHRRRRTATR